MALHTAVKDSLSRQPGISVEDEASIPPAWTGLGNFADAVDIIILFRHDWRLHHE